MQARRQQGLYLSTLIFLSFRVIVNLREGVILPQSCYFRLRLFFLGEPLSLPLLSIFSRVTAKFIIAVASPSHAIRSSFFSFAFLLHFCYTICEPKHGGLHPHALIEKFFYQPIAATIRLMIAETSRTVFAQSAFWRAFFLRFFFMDSNAPVIFRRCFLTKYFYFFPSFLQ